MVIRRKAGGFTLAEILITLVIIGFVGALGIPMLGQTKLKKPVEIKAAHGTIECFYKNGNLYQYTANNGEKKNGELKQVTDACYFSAPTANFFVAQAIGAGGAGAVGIGYNVNKPWYKDATVNISGNIPVNDNFLLSITNEDVPDWVRNEWNKQWLDSSKYVEYELNSPLGASGNGACYPMRIDVVENSYNDCSMECVVDINKCPEYCLNRYEADGGDSGKGAKYKVRTKIYFDPDGLQDYISYTTNVDETTLKVGSKYVTLKPSGDGANGKVIPDNTIPIPVNGVNGENFQVSASNNKYFEMSGMELKEYTLLDNAQKGGSGCNISNKERQPGSIKSTTGDIPYYTESLAIKAYFGLAGEPGENVTKVLEKLPKGTDFKLIPAKTTSESSKLYVKNNETGNWDLFMNAASGSDSYARTETIAVEKEDLPFPRKYFPYSFRGSYPEITIATGAGYRSYINAAHINPGKAGSGAHPIVTKVDGTAVHRINNVITGNETLQPVTADDVNLRECFDGSITDCSKTTEGHCPEACGGEEEGSPGAIIIAW